MLRRGIEFPLREQNVRSVSCITVSFFYDSPIGRFVPPVGTETEAPPEDLKSPKATSAEPTCQVPYEDSSTFLFHLAWLLMPVHHVPGSLGNCIFIGAHCTEDDELML